jgi:hypothetical protein
MTWGPTSAANSLGQLGMLVAFAALLFGGGLVIALYASQSSSLDPRHASPARSETTP